MGTLLAVTPAVSRRLEGAHWGAVPTHQNLFQLVMKPEV